MAKRKSMYIYKENEEKLAYLINRMGLEGAYILTKAINRIIEEAYSDAILRDNGYKSVADMMKASEMK